MIKNFSNWYKWDEKSSYKSLKPGIYIISYSPNIDRSNSKPSWSDDIIYIGMTNSKGGLKQRLTQFDNTIRGKRGHGGADRVMNDFHHLTYDEFTSNLFVSILEFNANTQSPTPDDYRVMGDVAKAEYECFAQYMEQSSDNNLPKYNQRSSQKRSHSLRKQAA